MSEQIAVVGTNAPALAPNEKVHEPGQDRQDLLLLLEAFPSSVLLERLEALLAPTRLGAPLAPSLPQDERSGAVLGPLDDLAAVQDVAACLDGQEMAAPSSSLCSEVAENGTPKSVEERETEDEVNG
jgi:hypothetical protein